MLEKFLKFFDESVRTIIAVVLTALCIIGLTFKSTDHDRQLKEIKARLQTLEDGSYVKEVRKSLEMKP